MKKLLVFPLVLLLASCAGMRDLTSTGSDTGLGSDPFEEGGRFLDTDANAMNNAINDNDSRLDDIEDIEGVVIMESGVPSALTDLPEEATPTSGDYFLIDVGGTSYKIDVDNMPGGSLAITETTASNWKVFYSADGSIPVELSLGADGTYFRSAGASSAPTMSVIQAGDLPVEIDPDKIGTDGTANDKIEAANLNIQSMDINIVDSIFWPAGSMSADGTQCADPSEVTLNSGPIQFTAVCADNDGSTLYGHVVMPDGFGGSGADAFTVTFELEYLQTASDTGVMNSDITAMCRSAGDTVNNTWGTEVAIDDAAVTGSNAIDHTTSAAVTPNGTCAAGDTLFWRWQLDAAGTTTAVATLHILGMKMEFTKVLGDS